MTHEEFIHKFPDEATCQAHWKAQRERIGITCYKCGKTEMYWNKPNKQWRCKSCLAPTSLRKGTVMENSHLPFRMWYKAFFLVSSTKKGISATEMQSQLGHKFYEPIWYMMQKIRVSQGDRDSLYELSGLLEADDAFVTVVDKQDENIDESKRGRGSIRKRTILVVASTEKGNGKRKGRPSSKAGYFKMFVMKDLNTESIQETMFRAATINSEVRTDGYHSYRKLKELFRKHNGKTIPANQAHIKLPWVHSAIGNLKRWINGIYHHVSDIYLQNYLDEFCYKLNRRWMKKNLFNRMIVAGITKNWA